MRAPFGTAPVQVGFLYAIRIFQSGNEIVVRTLEDDFGKECEAHSQSHPQTDNLHHVGIPLPKQRFQCLDHFLRVKKVKEVRETIH